MLGALYDTLRYDFLLGGICQLVSSLVQVFAPYMTRYLIAFATEAYVAERAHRAPPNIGHGLGFVFGITVMQLLQSWCTNQFIYRGMLVGGQIRAVLVAAIFAKAMKLSGRAKASGRPTAEEVEELRLERDRILQGEGDEKNGAERGAPSTAVIAQAASGAGRGWNNGRIVTLMSVDVERINTAMGMFHIIWMSPIAIIITLILLLINIGYSCLSGYALLVLGIPFLTLATRALVLRRKGINKLTDERVSLTQEILQGVRFVKFFGWESSFLNRLKEIRGREIHSIQRLLATRNGIMSVSMSMPIFASMLSFITYSLTRGHTMSAAPIFSSMALFNALRMPLNFLPIVIGQVADAYTALNRVTEFLLAEERKEDIELVEGMENAVEMDHASFTWERMDVGDQGRVPGAVEGSEKKKKDQNSSTKSAASDSESKSVEPFQLTDLQFHVGRKELLAVIGTVGCGKSSLLAALAGDMRLTGGSVRMSTTRAFCPQHAWSQNATVRQNILFGKEFDEKWYNQVVDACALRPDLEILPNGDQTEIGERGITLSGGQKQRLNIARAIYFNADLILMDDPLSAVDAHVGKHIMDEAICRILKDRCRILATHQLHVLNRCDRILVMDDDGGISAIDTFDNLMRDNDIFRRLLATTSQQEKANDVEDDDDDGETEVDGEDPEKGHDNGDTPTSRGPESPASKGLMQQEERSTSSLGWAIWKAYISATGSFFNCFSFLISLVMVNGSNIMTSLWLSFWTSNKYPYLSTGQYIGIYAGLGIAQTLLQFVFSTITTTCGTNASRTMLLRAMSRVLRAPMSFFDTTPLGRIINRFSKDTQTMDTDLTDSMRIYALTATMIISVMILIIAFFHYFAVALCPLFILFLMAAGYYRGSARDLKRHESVLRSIVYSRFSEAINGTASIRAYGVEQLFNHSVRDSINTMNGAYFLTFANQRWLSVRVDAVGILLVFVTGLLVVTSRFDVSPSIAGLVLSYILSIFQMLQFTIRQLAAVENDMNATERVHYYGTHLEEEAPLRLGPVEPSWPQTGTIEFVDAKMRYRPGLPLVLKGLSMTIHGGERIGIVGRTGAGKSSIMSCLFRLTELSGGCVKIDGVDIATVGLHDLRSRLSIIPQDPVLFTGTVRSNLDPFDEQSDLELWRALRQAHLIGEEGAELEPASPSEDTASDGERTTDEKEVQQGPKQQPIMASKRPALTLESRVEEEGVNFSLGQRQLLALARALVRDSRVIVADEATSSVDFETDAKIQRTMATGFDRKTVLCIAHRLKTIIHYDRICVMDQGQIAEMDSPLTLYDMGGIFRAMCDRSGISREDIITC